MAFGFNFAKPPVQQPKPNQQQQQPNQQQPQGNGQPTNGMHSPTGGNNEPGGVNNPGPGNNVQNAGNGSEADPFANYAKMFDNSGTETDTPPAFAIDPKVLGDIAGKQDFMQGLDPQLMQRATSGDTAALMEIIQASSRNAYRTAIEHGGMLTDKFVGAREAHSAKGLGSRVKQELTTHALSDSPTQMHPVVRQQLTEIASRLSKQHPDAAPGEIAKMAKDYISQLSQALNPQDPNATANNQQGNKPVERDAEYWDKYFEQGES